jgi:ABC-type transport system involved in multi-copper enzyme maturation permease subunit
MTSSIVHLTVVEMRRALHRRLVRWMIVLAASLSALAGVIVFLTSRDPEALAREPTHPAHMASWWGGGGEDSYLLTAALFLVVGAAICGASVAGAEWKAGTITTALTWEPMRHRLHAARTASAAILAITIGFALEVVYLAAALPAVALNGSTDGTNAGWWAGLLLAMTRVALITSLVAVLAVSVATIGRNTSAALVAMAAWALVVERIVAGLRPQWARFMVSENVATVIPWSQMTNVDFERPPIVALAALLAYLAAVVALAAASFTRRDVIAG